MQALPVNPLLRGVVAKAFVTGHASADTYRVMPSVYTVIGFQFEGRIDHVSENRALSTFGVTGILDKWREFRSEPKTESLLLFFEPGGFYRLFGAVAGELGSASLAMHDVVPSRVSRGICDILETGKELSQKWQRVQHFLLQLLSRDLSPEAMGALYHLQTNRGERRISQIAKDLAVSPRTLERRFAAQIGASPKHLARIVRWREAMQNLSRARAGKFCRAVSGGLVPD